MDAGANEDRRIDGRRWRAVRPPMAWWRWEPVVAAGHEGPVERLHLQVLVRGQAPIDTGLEVRRVGRWWDIAQGYSALFPLVMRDPGMWPPDRTGWEAEEPTASGSTLPATPCPWCGSDEVVPVVYGFPGPDLEASAHAGEFALGGCELPVSSRDPISRWSYAYECRRCRAHGGRLGDDDEA